MKQKDNTDYIPHPNPFPAKRGTNGYPPQADRVFKIQNKAMIFDPPHL